VNALGEKKGKSRFIALLFFLVYNINKKLINGGNEACLTP